MSDQVDSYLAQCLLFIREDACYTEPPPLAFAIVSSSLRTSRPDLINIIENSKIKILWNDNEISECSETRALEITEFFFDEGAGHRRPLIQVEKDEQIGRIRYIFPGISVLSVFLAFDSMRAAVDESNDAAFSHLFRLRDRRGHHKTDAVLLYESARRGHLPLCRAILNEGVHVDGTVWKGRTPLHGAVDNGHIEIISLLLEKEANANAEDENGEVPLFSAVRSKHLQIVRMLVAHGANVNHRTASTWLLNVAVATHDPAIVHFLVEEGASVNVVGSFGRTVLFKAVFTEYIPEILLKNGADPNHEARDQTTAIFTAVEYGRLENVKVLIKYGARADLKDIFGTSVLEIAYRKGHAVIFQYLLENCFLNAEKIKESGMHEVLHQVYEYGEIDFFPNDTFLRFCSILGNHTIKIDALHYPRRPEPGIHIFVAFTYRGASIFCHRYPSRLAVDYHLMCLDEVQRLRRKMGDTKVSFHDVLSCDDSELPSFLRNDTIALMVQAYDLLKEFPIYGTLLEYRIQKGKLGSLQAD